DSVSMSALGLAGLLVVLLVVLRWVGIWQLRLYVLTGLGLWAAVYASGVHPTLAGVLLGLLVPASPVDPRQQEWSRFYGRAVFEAADAARARLAVLATRATVPAN